MPQCDLLYHQLIYIFANKSALMRTSLVIIDNIWSNISETVCDGFCCYFVVTIQKGYRTPAFDIVGFCIFFGELVLSPRVSDSLISIVLSGKRN